MTFFKKALFALAVFAAPIPAFATPPLGTHGCAGMGYGAPEVEVQMQIDECTHFIKSRPWGTNEDVAYSYANRGTAYSRLGDIRKAVGDKQAMRNAYRQAAEDFDAAIKESWSLPEAYYERGIFRYRQGQLEGALSDFKEALSQGAFIDDLNGESRTRRAIGLVRAAKGELWQALNQYNMAIHLNENYARAYFERAQVLVRMDRREEALSNLVKAREIEPNEELYQKEFVKIAGSF